MISYKRLAKTAVSLCEAVTFVAQIFFIPNMYLVAIGVAVWHFRSRDDGYERLLHNANNNNRIRKESPWNSFSQACSPITKQHNFGARHQTPEFQTESTKIQRQQLFVAHPILSRPSPHCHRDKCCSLNGNNNAFPSNLRNRIGSLE